MWEERETDDGETDRNKWIVCTMTTMMEERGEGDHREFVRPYSSSPEPVAAHPVTLGRRPQPNTRGGKRSARVHGVPSQGKALLNPSIHTHVSAHYSHPHSTCPLDLTIETQEQIS